ncbi:MAG: hypothetical protein OEM67_09040 [Thermoleophilia bacterium]|nr:hypothetical protein [Thermoleophilia bacterium]MDH3724266.1 hypothetical protein [Thermoleophilia bacterium]
MSLRFPSGNTKPVSVLAVRPFRYHGIPGMAQRVVVDLGSGQTAEAIQVGEARVAFLDPRFSQMS